MEVKRKSRVEKNSGKDNEASLESEDEEHVELYLSKSSLSDSQSSHIEKTSHLFPPILHTDKMMNNNAPVLIHNQIINSTDPNQSTTANTPILSEANNK